MDSKFKEAITILKSVADEIETLRQQVATVFGRHNPVEYRLWQIREKIDNFVLKSDC